MPAPASRRARILQNLQRQLETITTSNGYAQQVYKVTTDVKNWQETPEAETPVLYIIDESTAYAYNAGRTLLNDWRVSIYGVMRNKTQLEMEELIADIEDCIFRNITLSFDGIQPGPVSHIRFLECVTDNQLFAQIEGSQLFKLTMEIKYSRCADNPR